MRHSILNNRLNIYQCKNNNNRDELIEYYNEYNIVERVKIKNIKTITLEPDDLKDSNKSSIMFY